MNSIRAVSVSIGMLSISGFKFLQCSTTERNAEITISADIQIKLNRRTRFAI
jgi:hypothetical protein